MNPPRWDTLLINATLATFAGDAPYGLIEHGAIAMHHGRIAWLGRMAELPGEPASLADSLRTLEGALVTPGLIDCHTQARKSTRLHSSHSCASRMPSCA